MITELLFKQSTNSVKASVQRTRAAQDIEKRHRPVRSLTTRPPLQRVVFSQKTVLDAVSSTGLWIWFFCLCQQAVHKFNLLLCRATGQPRDDDDVEDLGTGLGCVAGWGAGHHRLWETGNRIVSELRSNK